MLTKTDHDHFVEHGYIILRGIVPAELCARAADLLEHQRFEGDPALGTYKPVQDDILEAIATPELLDAARSLAGGPIVLREQSAEKSRVQDRPRPQEPDKTWQHLGGHCDTVDVTLVPDTWAMGCFVFLTPVRSHGGAFCYAPGSPRRYRQVAIREGSYSVWGLGGDEKIIGELHECVAEPGDAIIYSHLMGHAGSLNTDDPTTRHAMLMRFQTPERVTPALKGGDLSPLERANSLSHLRCLGDALAFPEPGADPGSLATGVGDSSIATHAIGRVNGNTVITYVTSDEPAVIKSLEGTSLTAWQQAASATLPAPIVSLEHDNRYKRLATVVTDDGTNFLDVATGQSLARLDGVTAGRPRFVLVSFGARQARGQLVHGFDRSDPTIIRWWTRPAWDAPSDWDATGTAHVSDVAVTSSSVFTLHDSDLFALVCDTADGPVYSLSPHADDFPDALAPFRCDDGGEASQIRLYERGRAYWLVTYLRDGGIFFGAVDWLEAPGVLQCLDTTDKLRRALALVGLA